MELSIILYVIYFVSMFLAIDIQRGVANVDYISWKRKNKLPKKSNSDDFEKYSRRQYMNRVWNTTTLMIIILPLINTAFYLFSLFYSLYKSPTFGSKTIMEYIASNGGTVHSTLFKNYKPKWIFKKLSKNHLDDRDAEYIKNKKNEK